MRGKYHILAASSLTDERTRVLKHGDTFAVFDHYGDIRPGGLGEQGLYHEGTRYLSCLVMELEGGRPFFLSSTVRDENDQLAVALTNPDWPRNGCILPLGAIHLALKKFLWRGVCHQQLRVKNYAPETVETAVSFHFAADYADIYEVRGMKRKAHGEHLAAEVGERNVTLGYRGLDNVQRRTALRFNPRPARVACSAATFALSLAPQQEAVIDFSIHCLPGHPLAGPRESAAAERPIGFEEARAEAQADLERYRAWSCHVRTSNGQVNAWINRAVADLHMMTTDLSSGPYPYAGVPWFNTCFGRDGIITALECLWLRPALARGVLAYLAATQATEVIAAEDAEPGKILHETRNGEMAALGEMPFGRYYGSVDATPLFVQLAGAYYERTADRAFIEGLWPNIAAALRWIDDFGDLDGDGFVEYQRRTPAGLLHQGWKDSDDALFHADGSPARGPIAVCEVQGYVYAARLAGAALAELLGLDEQAAKWRQQAETLRQSFERDFWYADLPGYAPALDGQKRPCRVRASNQGHCLFTGIAATDRAERVVNALLGPDSFSGWGVRTVAATECRYNPMGYHTGAVWPHDNALIAAGAARYGLTAHAVRIWNGMFAAGMYFELQRMPELFCGFVREPGEGPVLYPVACSPQSWAAASLFLMLQACLGLKIDARASQISFTRPQLPASLSDLRIHNLEIAGATVDLLLERYEHDVGLNVLQRDGNVQIVVAK